MYSGKLLCRLYEAQFAYTLLVKVRESLSFSDHRHSAGKDRNSFKIDMRCDFFSSTFLYWKTIGVILWGSLSVQLIWPCIGPQESSGQVSNLKLHIRKNSKKNSDWDDSRIKILNEIYLLIHGSKARSRFDRACKKITTRVIRSIARRMTPASL